MKQKFRALATGLVMALPGALSAAEATTTIEVSGLYCASCPYIAAQAIMAVPSAKITDGYYDPKAQMAQFVVKYDDSVATLKQLVAATSEYGYPAKKIDAITPASGS